LDRNIYARLKTLIMGKTAVKGPKGVKPNSTVDDELLSMLSRGQWWQLAIADEGDAQIVEALHDQYETQKRTLDARFEDKVEKVRRGDDLPPGVMKMVKVFIAVKRKLQPGDKMAGRHGNKGVISKVVPMEDMPFLADGTPVDFCLNPLGVPSRMNVGQILETHMGWAARGLGLKIDEALQDYRRSGDLTPVREAMQLAYGDAAYEGGIGDMSEDALIEAATNVINGVPIATPVFDGAKEGDVNDALMRAGFDTSGNELVLTHSLGSQIDITNFKSEKSGVAEVRGLQNTDGYAKFLDDGGSAEDLSRVSEISLATSDGAEAALDIIDRALEDITAQRSELGAVSNRLDHTISNLGNIVVNTEAAQSRIEDADFAAETGNLTKAQILSQAATAMLAQANASKQSVLSLLQG
jgi:flagellin-like hook-associated protein FlgL